MHQSLRLQIICKISLKIFFKCISIICILAAFILSCYGNRLSDDDCSKLLIQNAKVIAEDESIALDLKESMLEGILDQKKKNAYIFECKKTRSRQRFLCEMKASAMKDLIKCSKDYPAIQENIH